jgi:hypothetical protein
MNVGDRDVVRTAPVRIGVHAPDGPYWKEPARVILRQGAQAHDLERVRSSLQYEGAVEPGTYVVEARTRDLVAPPRLVTVPEEGKATAVYLGRPDWPFYRLGEHIVPFEPHDDLLAIAFDAGTPEPDACESLVERLCQGAELDPFPLDPERPSSYTAANGAIWLFRPRHPQLASRRAPSIIALLGRPARVGMPVNLTPGRVSVLDTRFVIRFRQELQAEQIAALVDAADATVLRGFIQAPNARLIEFRSGGYRDHLGAVESWFAAGHLVYGEPDLLSGLVDHVFPGTTPDDPKYGSQKSLRLQGVDCAWQYLESVGLEPLGSPNVCVMILDKGIDTSHPDVGGNLTDGCPQLTDCYDFGSFQPCGAPDFAPDSHGMGVYGIIAAPTNNHTGIAGIAPNTRQLAVTRPDLTSATYPDVLLWGAGFVTNHTPPWPAEPTPYPADIINCSHGVPWLALSGLMDDTLHYLTDNGRNGLGTVVIYSAGNEKQLLTDYLTWAAHPRTLAVANSNARRSGHEHVNKQSAYGPELDLCAQGEGAWSLTLTTAQPSGLSTFGGTSAAAPMVSATAALMLSANRNLRWSDVRDILCNTAKKLPDGIGKPADWKGGFSKRYGHGRLDAEAAVRAAHLFVPAMAPP